MLNETFNFDTWEQRKLGDTSDSFEYGLNASATEFDGENKYIRITDIDDDSRKFKQDKLTSPEIKFSGNNNYLLKKGDILLTRTGASVGKSYRYQDHDGKVYYAGFLIRARININNDSKFVFQITLTDKYRNFINVTSQRSGQPGVNAKEYSSFPLYAPKLKEQSAIGVFFEQLDNAIALHQEKLHISKEMKRGFLQVLFPKTGESTSELRLTTLEGDWQRRELGDISDKITEKNIDNVFLETFTNSAEYGIISQRDFFDKDISNNKNLDGYYIVREDYFVYNPRISNFAPVGPIKQNKLGRPGVMSPLYYVFKTYDINTVYLEFFFNSTYWYKFMKLNGDSGARADRFAIKDAILKKMPIPYPSLMEQERIGIFFKKFDSIVGLHQKKIDKLQQIKKAYLQKMFI